MKRRDLLGIIPLAMIGGCCGQAAIDVPPGKTVCAKCKNIIRYMGGLQFARCRATPFPEQLNFVTGKVEPSTYQFCSIVNHGDCPKYDPIKAVEKS